MAQNCRITITTLKNWKNTYPEFLASLKTDVKTHLKEVVGALLKKAKGMTVTEREEEWKEVLNVKTGQVEKLHTVKETTREIPPDVGAINTVLANRDFAKWRRNDPPAKDAADDWMKSPETVAEAMLKQAETIMGAV